MEDRTKKLMYVAGGVVAIAIIALIVRAIITKTGQPAAPVAQQPAGEAGAPTQPLATTTPKTIPEPIKSPGQPMPDTADGVLKRAALDFAARFGTYSTDVQNQNLKQLLPVMTGDLRTWAEKKVAEPPKFYIAYQGVTTRALAAKIISQTSKDAKVEVSTQRVYTSAAKITTEYETARLHLIVSGSNWLVDSAEWVKTN